MRFLEKFLILFIVIVHKTSCCNKKTPPEIFELPQIVRTVQKEPLVGKIKF